MKHRIFYIFAWAGIISSILLLFSFVYFNAIDGNPPVRFYNIPFPVDKQIYKRGEEIKMYLDVCKYEPVPATSYIQFSNYYLHHLSPITLKGIETGCAKLWSSPIKIPYNLETGTWKLQGANEYRVNFLRTRSVSWETQEFEVVE